MTKPKNDQPDPDQTEPLDNPENPAEQGDPDAIDIGDHLAVPEAEQKDTDDPEPNDDADADLSDVPDGEVGDVGEDDDEPGGSGRA